MGGVRTALYNYLFAKQKGGDFIIRIEDTDSHRFVPGAEAYIIEALSWCGIKPDEGVDENGKVVEVPSEKHPHAPYRQSQRKPIYREYAEKLISNGYAYYAFDSSEELAECRAKAEQSGQTFTYDSKTRLKMKNSLTLPEDEVKKLLSERTDWTVRFKMPQDTVVKMDDLIRGHIEVNTDTLDDKVLWKRADELPTYHLANIVDDHLMEITQVIRGEEWLPSLPLHYMLYKAFGWENSMPQFAHLSLLLKPDGKGKLSKRDGDKMGFPVFPLQWVNSEGEVYRGYREDGYFPEAFVNLLAFLGWNPGDDREIFSMDELIEAFSLDRIVKAGARFNAEKARWYNREYLRKKSTGELVDLLTPILEGKHLQCVFCKHCAKGAGASVNDAGADFEKHVYTREYLESVVDLVKERASFVKDIWEIAPYLFISPEEFASFGVKAGASTQPKGDKAPDPRAKVYDETLTAPFLAKDSEKFWTPENKDMVSQAVKALTDGDFPLTKDEVETFLEDFIKGKEWPMGKVMNTLRLVLTGSSSGLGIADIICRIGREELAKRMDYAVKRLG